MSPGHHAPPLTDDLSRLLVRELDTFVREIDLLPGDEWLWKTAGGVANPCGTLALHCAGNLQHYVGALLGGSGYVRDRAREFADRTGTREDVRAELRRARDIVKTTLAALPASALDGDFPEAVGGVTLPARLFLLHLSAHLAFHAGQAGYLRRILTGSTRTADAVSVKRV